MHLPRVKAMPVVALLCAGIWLSILGCAGESGSPPVPTEIQVMDIPQDNGTSVAISWRHFSSSSARQYDIYFSADPDSLENNIDEMEPISRGLQAAIFIAEDTAICSVGDLEYYIVLEETESGAPPVASVVKATPENRDSLKAIGELIVGTEFESCPPDEDTKELQFALGKFFRIRAHEGELGKKLRTIEKSTLQSDTTGLKIVPDKSALVLETGYSRGEIGFVEAGPRILPYSEEESEYLHKYGREIVAILTEKTRISLSSEVVQVLIAGDIEPGVEYHYKIFASDIDGNRSDAVTGTFSPQDEPPMAPAGASAILDTVNGELLVTWMGYNPSLAYFRDVDHYEIHRFIPGDSLMESGELLGYFNADYDRALLTGKYEPSDMFYIASYDAAGQRVAGEPFGMTPGALSKPEMVSDLRLVDVENDDGQALAIRWDSPTVGITVNIKDFSPEYAPVNIPDGYYLVGGELATFENDSLVPPNAVRIYSGKESVTPESYSVVLRYDIYKNDGDKVYFAKLRVDEDEWFKDFEELGFLNIPELATGEHVFEAWLLDESGRDLESPEAHVTKQIIIDETGLIRENDPPEIVQIWRSNAEIDENGEVLLTGTLHYDHENMAAFDMVGQRGVMDHQYQDNWPDSLRDVGEYYYFSRVVAADGSFTDSEVMGPLTPTSQFFHSEKAVVLVLVILFVIFVNYFLMAARRGKDFYLRPIAGISHLDEALGRATEMGRPILYVLGLTGISDIATLAGLTILGRVAKKTAEFQTKLIVPCYDPIVLIVAQETVKTSYMDAGRPDAYNEDDIFYAAGSQFSYAAAVAGMMVRFKTAANFYMGMFFAESLILSETGSMSGSIQIAGTDAVTQIPFFITTCDYTLIGEEIYAASAYLSQDPLQVGSLKAQDMLKAIYMVVIVLGTISMTSGFLWFINLFKVRLEQ